MTPCIQKNEIDMLHGPMTARIVRMALPLAAISILQQFFNAADIAVVGRFASDTALAAVGANTPIINMFLTFFTGISTGGNVTIATLIGKQDTKKIHHAVQTVFTLSLIGAVLMLILGELFAAPLLRLIQVPENVIDQSLLYLRIYLFALMFAVIYNFAAAILRSKGDTKRPLYCLIASGIINVILNLVFVIGFSLDVVGVAAATLIANFVCAAATVVLLIRETGPLKLSVKELRLVREHLSSTLYIGLPTGIQGMTFSVSNIIIQWGINGFGDDCIAGNTAAMNFEFIAFFIINAFAQTATTYTSQNYGAGNKLRCRMVCRRCLVLGLSICFLCSAIFYTFSDFWLGLFTKDANILAYAMVRMKYVVLLECLTGLNEIPASIIRGMGISIPPTIIAISGSCILRIIWILTVFRVYHSNTTLMLVYPVSWIFLACAMAPVYLFLAHKNLSLTKSPQLS